MASQVKWAYFVVLLALFAMVVVAHEGHDHTPGEDIAPSPNHYHDQGKNHGNFAYPSTILGVLALALPFLAFSESY